MTDKDKLIAELKAKIKKYAAINEQETKDYAELKAENNLLKSQIKDLQIRKDRYYLKGLEQERQISDYITLLQEIKAIAEADSPFINNFEIKSATEVGYDYAAICNELELRLHKVLELITKVEV